MDDHIFDLDQVHPLASLFPEMTVAEFEALKRDIEQNGQRDPVTLYEGKIIDGRNRALACHELGHDLVTEQLPEGECPVQFILSKNICRRNLTAGQRAAIIVSADEMLTKIREAAKERQRDGGRKAGRGREKEVEIVPQPDAGKSRDKLGALAGVSGRTVDHARKIQEYDPDLLDEVRAGEISLAKASQVVRQREYQQLLESVAGIDPHVAEILRESRVHPDIGEMQFLAGYEPNEQLAMAEALASGRASSFWEARAVCGPNTDEAKELVRLRFVTPSNYELSQACFQGLKALNEFEDALDTLGILELDIKNYLKRWKDNLNNRVSTLAAGGVLGQSSDRAADESLPRDCEESIVALRPA